jgi:hypothetical protein
VAQGTEKEATGNKGNEEKNAATPFWKGAAAFGY